MIDTNSRIATVPAILAPVPPVVSRRSLMRGGLALGLGMAMPSVLSEKVYAQASTLTEYERRIVTVAKEQAERMSSILLDASIVAVADFARPSALPRLHFVDVTAGAMRSHLVAHGRGSDPEHIGRLQHFSNIVGSLATSRGAYLTSEQYDGKYGPSMRLRGLDETNSNAADRAIVMHPAWYAAPDMLTKYGKLGRSEGCFAMAPDEFHIALQHLGSGRLLYAGLIGEA
ncbi:twin-arginine translocation pathway signal [Novosphingobium sp. FSY-8]|uniref:Twin-arginine translocation pathway signal n=2 Tax=Novosphingobium ovatum TaxID=1908523 RepID=A0ABW9XGG1_9SPHN|nr:twin-arginine translocation pathway signal [Novosphingobium ovatum]